MDWTDERVETLTRLWREGFSAAQVARQLGGVTRSAVIGKVHRLGIAGRDTPSRPRASVNTIALRRASAGGALRLPTPRTTAAPPRAPHLSFEVAPTATIHTLTEGGCRWPIGEPDEADFGFCGRLRAGQGAYCAGHGPMATRRRESPMKIKEIDRLVSRFAEGAAAPSQPADFSWREIALNPPFSAPPGRTSRRKPPMTTLIFIENVLGSGQTVKLTEDFGDYSVCRELRPGENARIVVSPFKSIAMQETPLVRGATAPAANEARQITTLPSPRAMNRRFG
jgi:GcrA cell cycle regulator